ncbi:MAG: hypothetical protein P8M78_16845 [Myxococcota bacterium]|nr:hypothetical protein [Myxococcota bacterium]
MRVHDQINPEKVEIGIPEIPERVHVRSRQSLAASLPCMQPAPVPFGAVMDAQPID